MFKVNIPINEIHKTIKNNVLKLFDQNNNLDQIIDEELNNITDFKINISEDDILINGIEPNIIKTILYKNYYNAIITGINKNAYEDIILIIIKTKLIGKDLFKKVYHYKNKIILDGYAEDSMLYIFHELKLSNEEDSKIQNDLRKYILLDSISHPDKSSNYNLDKNESIGLLFCKVLNDIILQGIEYFTGIDLNEIRIESIHRESCL